MTSSKYPNKNPNLTDEDVDEWLLRVSGQHPDQLAQEERDRKREAERLSHFPHEVECSMDRVMKKFDAAPWQHGDGPPDMTWHKNFMLWVKEEFGPEAQFWQFDAAQGRPFKGTWCHVSYDFWFQSADDAAKMKAAFGGEDWHKRSTRPDQTEFLANRDRVEAVIDGVRAAGWPETALHDVEQFFYYNEFECAVSLMCAEARTHGYGAVRDEMLALAKLFKTDDFTSGPPPHAGPASSA